LKLVDLAIPLKAAALALANPNRPKCEKPGKMAGLSASIF
jgi:hypothetical protein